MSETKLQRQLIQHLAILRPKWCVFHVPNGGKRDKVAAAKLKQAGVLAGVADLCCMLPDGKVLWLEVKLTNGVQSDAQQVFENVCKRLNHRYFIVKSVDDMLTLLQRDDIPKA